MQKKSVIVCEISNIVLRMRHLIRDCVDSGHSFILVHRINLSDYPLFSKSESGKNMVNSNRSDVEMSMQFKYVVR